MSDTENKAQGTEAEDETETRELKRTFTHEETAAIHINCARPAINCLDALIEGGLMAVDGVSDEAHRELGMAQADLDSVGRHVDAAMTALGHGPERKHRALIGIDLGDLAALLRTALS